MRASRAQNHDECGSRDERGFEVRRKPTPCIRVRQSRSRILARLIHDPHHRTKVRDALAAVRRRDGMREVARVRAGLACVRNGWVRGLRVLVSEYQWTRSRVDHSVTSDRIR